MNANDIACLDAAELRHRVVLGYCVRRRRLAAGLTQVDLAARARISPSEVQHIEHARRDPRIGTLKRICVALGIWYLELLAEVERVEKEWDLHGRRA